MRFAKVNGIHVHYRVDGDPGRQPVLAFSNSLGTDLRIWDDVVALLAGDFAMVRYDSRGHGLSGLDTGANSIEDNARDLAGLLDHLGVKRAAICGLSVGGLIAQSLHALRPDLTAALILSDTAAKIGTADMWNARIAAVRAGGIASISATILERWFTPAFRTAANPAFAIFRNMLERTPMEGYAATCGALCDADLTDAARRIKAPTLCVVGDQDGSTPPALVEATSKLIPGARFAVVSGAGHLPGVEQPAAFARLVAEFLQSSGFAA
jgi:3-oxoadipate enol-lactonase